MRKPYFVCGGLQDNGSWCGPSATRSSNGILNSDWFRVGGGDGFYTAERSDRLDDPVFGVAGRRHLARRSSSRPEQQHPAAGRAAGAARRAGGGRDAGSRGQAAAAVRLSARNATGNIVRRRRQAPTYRFYWNTPFILSPHNPRTIYLGGDRLFRSYDRGDTWMASPDLTKNIGRNDRPIMGVAGNRADGVEARRRRVVQQHHHDQRIPGRARHDLGRHQRRQPPGEPRRRQYLEERRRQGPGRAEGDARLARRAVALRRRHRVMSPSMGIAPTIRSRTCSRRPTSARRGRRSRGTCPTGNVNVIREDPKNSEPAVPRHRIRVLRLARWRPGVEALHERAARPCASTTSWCTRATTTSSSAPMAAASTSSTTSRRCSRCRRRRATAEDVLFDIRPAWHGSRHSEVRCWRKGRNSSGRRIRARTGDQLLAEGGAGGGRADLITDITGREIRAIVGTKHAGFNRVQWDLLPMPPAVVAAAPEDLRRGEAADAEALRSRCAGHLPRAK